MVSPFPGTELRSPNLLLELQGQQIEVRGIQNVAQHVEVPSQECKDRSNANYPNGLVCSGEQGDQAVDFIQL